MLAPAKFRVLCTLDGRDLAVDEGQNIIFPNETMHAHWQELGDAATWAALEGGRASLRMAVHVDYSGPWPGETYRTAVGWIHTPPHTMTIDQVDVT